MATKTVEVRRGALDAAARAAYAKCMRFDTSGGLQSLDDMLGRCELFELHDGEAVIGRYALRVNEWAHGREGIILAAVGNAPGLDLTAAFLPTIEQQLAGVDAVLVVTRRKHLVNKLLQAGYELNAFMLRKRLIP